MPHAVHPEFQPFVPILESLVSVGLLTDERGPITTMEGLNAKCSRDFAAHMQSEADGLSALMVILKMATFVPADGRRYPLPRKLKKRLTQQIGYWRLPTT